MSEVKTYQRVHSSNENLSFSICRMEDIYDNRNGKTDDPHRHDFYTVLVVKKAKGVHVIDFNSYDLGVKQIFFVSPGQVHQIVEEEKSFGYVMSFSNQFLIENAIHLSFIDNLHLFNNYGQNPPLLLNKEKFQTIENYVESIITLYRGDTNMKYQAIGSFLKIFLIECNNVCSINPIELEIDSTSCNLIRNFKREVENYYRTEHSTSFYADKLFISSEHLNRTVKSKIGKTAKDYIQTRIITEAKRLLYFSNLTNKEIGYQLGFNEPANFSAFFKKHTKLSPSKFKKATKIP